MSNKKNLKFFGKDKPPLTHEEAVRNGKKGGDKSVQVRRERKTFKNLYTSILDEEVETVVNGTKVKITKKDFIAKQFINKYMKGELNTSMIKGAEYITAMIGEAPVQKVEQTNYNIETKPVKADIEKLKKVRKEVFGIDD